ncbi:MAG: hypothetical protein ACFE0J_11305 [Elainellaceae cyanobacterium]
MQSPSRPTHQSPSSPILSSPPSSPPSSQSSQTHRSRRSDFQKITHAWIYPPSDFVSALWDAIAWLGVAVGLRLIADYTLSVLPGIWAIVAIILVTPALIAMGLSTVFPRMSSILVYRALLFMFGLLIGGKL